MKLKMYEIKYISESKHIETHFCYVASKSKKEAYEEANVTPSGFYPIKKIKREKAEKIKIKAVNRITQMNLLIICLADGLKEEKKFSQREKDLLLIQKEKAEKKLKKIKEQFSLISLFY